MHEYQTKRLLQLLTTALKRAADLLLQNYKSHETWQEVSDLNA